MIMIMIMNLLVTCGLSKRCSPLVITVFVMIVIIVNDNDDLLITCGPFVMIVIIVNDNDNLLITCGPFVMIVVIMIMITLKGGFQDFFYSLLTVP